MFVVIRCRLGAVNQIFECVFVRKNSCKTGLLPVVGETSATPTSPKSGLFAGKNAWKLGLLSLGFSGVSVVGLMLASWGPPLTDPDGKI